MPHTSLRIFGQFGLQLASRSDKAPSVFVLAGKDEVLLPGIVVVLFTARGRVTAFPTYRKKFIRRILALQVQINIIIII